MKLDQAKLKTKGWSDEEISQAANILEQAQNNRKPIHHFFAKATYWFFLFLLLGGSIVSAWLIQPFLLITNQLGAIIIIVLFGAAIGSIALTIVKDIEHIETHQHILIGLTIPLAAIITSIIISKQVSKLILIAPKVLGQHVNHNPYVLGIAFSIACLLPYSISLFIQRKHYETQ